MRGRKPLPVAIKIAEGNKSKLGKSALVDFRTIADGVGECPAHLQGEARAEWQRVTQTLANAGILKQSDAAALEMYCSLFAVARELQREISKNGVVVDGRESPAVRALTRATQMLARYLSEFGLTPTSRARVAPFSRVADPVAELKDFCDSMKIAG